MDLTLQSNYTVALRLRVDFDPTISAEALGPSGDDDEAFFEIRTAKE